jgi:hypothetical protein
MIAIAGSSYGHVGQCVAQVQKTEVGLGRDIAQLVETIVEKQVARLAGAVREQELIHHGALVYWKARGQHSRLPTGEIGDSGPG